MNPFESEEILKEVAPQNEAENESFEQKILLVDDDQLNRIVIKNSLEILGLEVELARDGQEAVDKFVATPFPMILMDCQMPVMNGYEASKRIKQLSRVPGKPVIVAFTANDFVEGSQEALSAGMDDFLIKPVTIEGISAMIEKWSSATKIGVTLSERQKIDQKKPPIFRREQISPSLDSKIILKRVKKKEFFARLVNTFISTNKKRLERLDDIVEKRDFKHLVREFHTLKGAAGQMGATTLAEHFLKLEVMSKKESVDSSYDDQLNIAILEFRKVSKELEDIVYLTEEG